MELQDRLAELSRAGISAAAISYDSVEILAGFAAERGITYPLLSDDDSAVITEFGILNTVAADALDPGQDDPDVMAVVEKYVAVGGAFEEAVGTPFPGTFVLDKDGIVKARYFEDFYRERNTTANVLLKLGIGATPVAAIEGATPELKFTAYPRNSRVTAGSRIAIAVRVEPNTDMHVYAPGADAMGYRVIRLNLEAGTSFRFEPVEYPESEIYHFKPLDEFVPVYQGPFTLLQEVVVSATNNAEAALRDLDKLTLAGSLDYQACDHEICYLPESIPLSFTFEIVEND